MKGYFKAAGRCQRCPNKAVAVLMMIAVFVTWYLLNSVFSRQIEAFGVILIWVQLANIIGDLQLRWPHNLQVVYDITGVMDFDVDMVEPACLGINWTFTHNFVVQMLLPVLLAGVSVVIYWADYAVFHWAKRVSHQRFDRILRGASLMWRIPSTDKEWGDRWDGVIAGAVASFEVVYLTVAKYCLDSLKCRQIAGISVLQAAPEIECDSDERKVLLALGSLGFLVHVLGYIGFVVYKLNHLRVSRAFCNAKNVRRYGILYAHYEIDYWWNEMVVLLRRLLFVIVFALGDSPGNQVGLLAMIVVASLMLHVYTTPYVRRSVDILFSFLLATLMAQAFSGLLFYNPDVSEESQDILEVLVLIVIAVLWLVFVFFIAWELLRKYRINKIHHFRQKVLKDTAEPSGGLLDSDGKKMKDKEVKPVMRS